eukprot:CAMPEP_0174711968 /NCGR_PEP_ID=MMETSP1094-20130205/13122_1 /TAXON_ID=156173 /ORGANISM="Chrysochromulina brevifilum, Strain UTEX LB 985" /LENGTH=405 /DNA_ID=CAMNT_0015910977 /DNA_START=84 /DNA_END=1298 /DNA_ORIENTATION=+
MEGTHQTSLLVRAIQAYLTNSAVVDMSVPWHWGQQSESVVFAFKDMGPLNIPLHKVAKSTNDAQALKTLTDSVWQARSNVTRRAKRAAKKMGGGIGQMLGDGTPEANLPRINQTEMCHGRLMRVEGPNEGAPIRCDASFRAQGPHLQDKFCTICRSEGILVPASRLRALSEVAMPHFQNNANEGFWKSSPILPCRYRLINQTKDCRGPPLILLDNDVQLPITLVGDQLNGQPPASLWLELPAQDVDEDMESFRRLWVAKGTMSLKRPRVYSQSVPTKLVASLEAIYETIIPEPMSLPPLASQPMDCVLTHCEASGHKGGMQPPLNLQFALPHPPSQLSTVQDVVWPLPVAAAYPLPLCTVPVQKISRPLPSASPRHPPPAQDVAWTHPPLSQPMPTHVYTTSQTT